MSAESVVTNVSGDIGDSGIDSPMGGAVDPSSIRRISELGSATAQAPKMTPLPELFGEPAKQPKQKVIEPEFDQQEVEVPAEMQDLTQEAEVVEGQLTAEQKLAKYEEWLDSNDVPEEFLDRVMWFDQGKGEMVPIRLKDVPDNIMMHKDYQFKTAQLAERNRTIDRYENGRKAWIEDVTSGDAERGLRAWRAMGGGKTMHQMVLKYIDNMAELESLPPNTRAQLLEKQRIEDELFFEKRRSQQLLQQHERAQQQEQQQMQEQGTAAPDVHFVQSAIEEALPSIYQELGISKVEAGSKAFSWHLDQALAEAASGERNADGTWKIAPSIQRGRMPSKSVLKQIVLEAKREHAKVFAVNGGKRKNGPKAAAPPTLRGSGPSAAEGQRGNISAPKKMRFSDLGKG